MKKSSTAIKIRSILLNIFRSAGSFDIHIMVAAPVDKPETKNSGPSNEVFHKGRALKADNRIPVYTPRITAKTMLIQARAFLFSTNQSLNWFRISNFQSHLGRFL